MKNAYKTILMIIMILSITTSLFAFNGHDYVLRLNGEITDFTVIKVTDSGVEVSSNVLGLNYTLQEDGPFRVINLIAG